MTKFEYVSRVIKMDSESKVPFFNLPRRATKYSAGYDFYAPEDVVIPPHEIKIIMTGVKCELEPNSVLILANRSSNPKKKNLVLINGVGIIDADYYNNPDNEGEIGFAFYNMSNESVEIKKSEKIGQGLITSYYITDNDYTTDTRTGGFGSTGN